MSEYNFYKSDTVKPFISIIPYLQSEICYPNECNEICYSNEQSECQKQFDHNQMENFYSLYANSVLDTEHGCDSLTKNEASTKIPIYTENTVIKYQKTEIHTNEIQLAMNFDANDLIFFQMICPQNDYLFEKISNNIQSDNAAFGILTNYSFCDNDKNSLNLFDKNIFLTIDDTNDFECIDQTKFLMSKGKLYIDTSNNNWILPCGYYDLLCHLKNSTVHFLFINTNLFNYNNIDDKNQCIMAKKQFQQMLKWLAHMLTKYNANTIFIVGNKPIFNMTTTKNLPKIKLFLDIIKNFAINTNYKKTIYFLSSGMEGFQYIRFTGKNIYHGLIIDQITLDSNECFSENENINDIGKSYSYVDQQGNSIGQIELLDKEMKNGYIQYTINHDNQLIIDYKIIDF